VVAVGIGFTGALGGDSGAAVFRSLAQGGSEEFRNLRGAGGFHGNVAQRPSRDLAGELAFDQDTLDGAPSALPAGAPTGLEERSEASHR